MPQPNAPSRKGGHFYFLATGWSQVVALLRYVVLARLLGPTELGLAATLVVTGAFFDLISDTGSDRFLIQDRDGDTAEVQKLVQLVYVLRGTAIAAALVLLAIPIAHFYRTPHLAAGFAVLALSPLIIGFTHLDLRRLQRDLDFRPEATAIVFAETASLVATAVAAYLTHSYTATLYGLISRSIIMVAISHLMAKRRYSFGYYREAAARLRAYSGPLMLTGMLLFVGSQGDRVLIGRYLGPKDLGQYSAVLLLVYYPAAMLLRYTHNVFMPLIAAGRDDPAIRDGASESLGGLTFLLAIAMALGFAVVAPTMVTILYGAKYTQSALLVGLIGVLQTTRFLINWPTTVAMSMGLSRTVLGNNIPRLLVFPGALAGYSAVGGLLGMVLGFAAGELCSIIIALLLMNWNSGRPWVHGFDRLTLFLGAAALIALWNLAMSHHAHWSEGALAISSIVFLAVLYRREHTTFQQAFALCLVQVKRLRRARA